MAVSAGSGSGGVDPAKSYVIVLIPEKNDEVWQVSSEKVPHLTLCYLGGQLDNVQRVTQFIGHLAATSLSRSTYGVDHRGVLGDKSADVLFFNDHVAAILETTRVQLLSNIDIATAYGMTEQFDTWKPHLTLGWPDAPAKTNIEGIPFAVTFDRIALWTGDFEGVEFPLKNDNEELSMAAKGEAFFQHFGVKGMHWGVRREDSGGSATSTKDAKAEKATTTARSNDAKLSTMQEKDRRAQTADKLKQKRLVDLKSSKDSREAGFVKTKAKISGVNTLSNQDLQTLITRMNLERQFKDLKKIEHEDTVIGMGKKWAGNFLNDVAKDTAASWLKRPGSNASGRTSARAYSWGQQVGGAIDGAVVPKAISA